MILQGHTVEQVATRRCLDPEGCSRTYASSMDTVQVARPQAEREMSDSTFNRCLEDIEQSAVARLDAAALTTCPGFTGSFGDLPGAGAEGGSQIEVAVALQDQW